MRQVKEGEQEILLDTVIRGNFSGVSHRKGQLCLNCIAPAFLTIRQELSRT